ncbi:Tn3 family transposase [Streptomyces sp. NPDC017056]|uniref:Tn3 family transposase n=1 Tax=Streptomyces sp. NPDC017056 TaxID=3364973 RepID=UPI0037A9FA10
MLLNEAVSDLVNAHARLDISQAWGDGAAVAADGTHMDTYLDNLLTETSVRYGKPDGIAYHRVSDTYIYIYIALFTHSIPGGAWEAVHIIEGPLMNASEMQPTTVHADTQGQSFPAYALAHLLGFENVIDFDLIESQFRHLTRVAASVREGTISSSTLLKRLRCGSRKNATYATYAAFREVGRVIRTVQLLRYLTDALLRRRLTAATNKVESFNRFGEYSTHELGIQPDAYDTKLDVDYTPLREQDLTPASLSQAA